jgi:DNA-nicking Smr family endonuclease
MSRRRRLSEEERALWKGFARSITPLREEAQAGEPPDAVGVETAPVAPVALQTNAPQEAPAVKRAPPLAPLGRRLRQRVARGREPIDQRLDLHGLTQKEAHAALLRFLRAAQANGAKTVLVVTGKGPGRISETSEREHGLERGILKRQVPMWLALPEFRPLVIGFEVAHASHGGQGALYVRLRRAQRAEH